ncbi:PAS domain-containing hybrid sensor histidine kinase/response regulator [Maliponia aquimaris]|uniref:histidine kinase n=1 Tax=Maliponia aquimaris TaxID=1673631 RepID=A0A238L6F7_9RHOB|nr:PAS domain-containing hybrid sensor histidine kinase/response regulator [Maliponia aquimaris]SMX50420.1 Aerobic respiration control sensor protein ArcB [Maliponia aquimaris]
MTRQQPRRALPRHIGGRSLLLGLALLCLGAIAYLVTEIVRDLRLLNTADSDNVQWTLSQAEVEFLEFQHALDVARSGADGSLDSLVEEYDIFFSRIATLAEGSLYEGVRAEPGFDDALRSVRNKMMALVPLIDGPREDLAARIDEMAASLDNMRQDVRALSTSGLSYFASKSDAQRTSVAVTLTRLALLTGLLVLALLYLLRHARQASRQTERRGRELAAAYARLNTILDTSLDGVIVADPGGRVLQFSPAAERIFRYAAQEAIGRNIGDLIVPDHLRAAHQAGMARMHATGEKRVVGHGRVRLEAMRAGGEVFPVEMALEMAQTGDEEMVIGFLRDISHRVAAENELVEARDRALAGEKAKADFLAMMTHEIRTPLNGVLGNLSLLTETPLTAHQERLVRNMGISGDLLMQHVDAVLDVARFEAGASVSPAEVVHLGRLVQDLVDSQASAASAHGNRLEWGWVGAPMDWVAVDASRLKQVLLNLVGNALKFTRQGRVSIELERQDGAGAPVVEFRIIDTGVGIAEDDIERVFGDFQTGSAPLAHAVPGTGLGLGIARRFVQAMGGEIGAESTLGEGSVFWVHLPVTPYEEPAEPEPGQDMSPAAAQPPCAILLVEDNEINMQLARDMLHLLGHQVTVAVNGLEGVQAAAQRRFDLILMDIRMPVMDGLAATRAIREGQGPNQATPIVALSANVLPEAKDRFISGGMSDFLGKPLSKTELAELIARCCRPMPTDHTPLPQASPPAAETDPMAALMARYMAEGAQLLDWLETRPEDMTEIAERAHRIAGSAAAFGQPDLRMALLKVEAAAEQDDAAALSVAITQARAAWDTAPAPSLG